MTRGLSFSKLAEGLLLGAVAVCALVMPAASDTYWHLRAGQEIWQTLHVPLADHYSYTAEGRFWPNHEWLWQALSYALHRGGGFPLLEAGGAAIVTGAVALMYRLMVGSIGTRALLIVLGLPLVSCAWALRPQLITQLMLMAVLWLLSRERYRWLPPLFLVWANAHGGVAMGGVVLAVVTPAALARARGGAAADVRRARALAVVTPLCALATLATPLGIRLWTAIAVSIRESHDNGIAEWRSSLELGPFQITFWVLAGAFVVLVLARRRRLRAASWADLVIWLAALVIFPLAVLAVRNTTLFLLVATPAASRLLGPDFGLRRRPSDAARSPDRPALNLGLFAAVCLAEGLAVVTAWRAPYANLNWRPLADGAVAAARDCPAQLYNRYNDGGYLIWLVPEKRVFVDNRQDPYPTAFVQEGAAVERGAPYAPLFRRHGIRCAFLPAGDTLAARLQSDGWRTQYADAQWTVLASGSRP
ncbi:MAG TPA: hypothetical protein VHO67_06710 [Polyangia bacterium]|nr:hypothetical protein [Polyangia bacterium]